MRRAARRGFAAGGCVEWLGWHLYDRGVEGGSNGLGVVGGGGVAALHRVLLDPVAPNTLWSVFTTSLESAMRLWDCYSDVCASFDRRICSGGVPLQHGRTSGASESLFLVGQPFTRLFVCLLRPSMHGRDRQVPHLHLEPEPQRKASSTLSWVLGGAPLNLLSLDTTHMIPS